MRDDERFIHDGIDLRTEQAWLLGLPVFNTWQHRIRTPRLKVRRPRLQPNRIGFARGGDEVSLSIGANTTLDRYDLQEALLHEDVHIWLQQIYPNERVGHDVRFWRVMDDAFEQAYGIDPASLPPRTNRFHRRYSSVMRRAAFAERGDQLTNDIDAALSEEIFTGEVEQFLLDHELTSVTIGERVIAVEPLEFRGATFAEVRAATQSGRGVRLPDGTVVHVLGNALYQDIIWRDDDGAFTPLLDPNMPRELTDREQAFIAGTLSDDDYERTTTVVLPEPLLEWELRDEPNARMFGGKARVVHEAEPRTGQDRGTHPRPVSERQVARGWHADQRDMDVRRVLRAHGEMHVRDIAAELNITMGQARHALWRQEQWGGVQRVTRGVWTLS